MAADAVATEAEVEDAIRAEYRAFCAEHEGSTPFLRYSYEAEDLEWGLCESRAEALFEVLGEKRRTNIPIAEVDLATVFVVRTLGLLDDSNLYLVWRNEKRDAALLAEFRVWRESMEEVHPDSIPVMHNTCFGGYGLSRAGAERRIHLLAILRERGERVEDDADRERDTVDAFVVDSLGSAADSLGSKPEAYWVRRNDVPFLRYSEYDGVETLSIDEAARQAESAHGALLRLRHILSEGGGAEERIAAALPVIEEYIDDCGAPSPSHPEFPDRFF